MSFKLSNLESIVIFAILTLNCLYYYTILFILSNPKLVSKMLTGAPI
jgi:hypothetical protein